MEKLQTLPDLLAEESKGSRLQIPSSLQKEITTFKDAYKERYNKTISRENVIILMMSHGIKGLAEEGYTLLQESSIPA